MTEAHTETGSFSIVLVEDTRLLNDSIAMPESSIVVMDRVPAKADVIDLIRAGARGLTLRDATASDIAATLRALANGLSELPPRLAGVLLLYAARGRASLRAGDAGSRLTHREREVVELISDGATNKEIASRLNIAIHTVKSHVHSVLEKLALHSRLQIANFFRESTGQGMRTG